MNLREEVLKELKAHRELYKKAYKKRYGKEYWPMQEIITGLIGILLGLYIIAVGLIVSARK